MATFKNPFGEDKPRGTRGAKPRRRGYSVRHFPKDPNDQPHVKAAIKAFEYMAATHNDDTVHKSAIENLITNGCVEVDFKTLSNSMRHLVTLAADGKLHTVFVQLPWDNGTFEEGDMIALRFDQDSAFGNDNIVRTCQASSKPGSGYTHIFQNNAAYFEIAEDLKKGTVVVRYSKEQTPIGHLELLNKNSPPEAPEFGWPIKNKDEYSGPYASQLTPNTRGDNYLNVSDLSPGKFDDEPAFYQKLAISGSKPLTVAFRRNSVTRYKPEQSSDGVVKNIAPEMIDDAKWNELADRRTQTQADKDFMGRAWSPEVNIAAVKEIPLSELKKQWQVKTHLAGLIAQGPVKVIDDDDAQTHLFTLTPLDYTKE